MTQYELEKWIWTEKDFETMGWHDATIYGLRLGQNLELDIDYILQWNQPEIEGFSYTFWIAPATLIFEKPTNVSFELTQTFDEKWLEIEDIEKATTDKINHWTIITQQGGISFDADTFQQIIRRGPSFQFRQSIPYDERGGFSFDKTSGDKVVDELRKDIAEGKTKELEHYEIAKNRFVLKKELELLSNKRDLGQIQTKDYLIEKKSLKERIDSYTFYLKGTSFEEW
jgi:hypothetical protein